MKPEGKDVLISGTARVVTADNGNQQMHPEPQIQYRSCFAVGVFSLDRTTQHPWPPGNRP